MSNLVTHTYAILGISDELSAMAVTAVIEAQPSVYYAHTSTRSGYAVVDADPDLVDPYRPEAVINAAGYRADLQAR